MENNDITKSMPMTLMILVAVLGIVSFLSPWFGLDAGKDIVAGASGIACMNNADGDFAMFVPLLTMILAIVALIVTLLPNFGVQMDAKVFNGIIAVIGLVIIILFFVFFMKEDSGLKLSDHLQIGAWLGLLIGIITIAVGGFGIYKAVNQ